MLCALVPSGEDEVVVVAVGCAAGGFIDGASWGAVDPYLVLGGSLEHIQSVLGMVSGPSGSLWVRVAWCVARGLGHPCGAAELLRKRVERGWVGGLEVPCCRVTDLWKYACERDRAWWHGAGRGS